MSDTETKPVEDTQPKPQEEQPAAPTTTTEEQPAPAAAEDPAPAEEKPDAAPVDEAEKKPEEEAKPAEEEKTDEAVPAEVNEEQAKEEEKPAAAATEEEVKPAEDEKKEEEAPAATADQEAAEPTGEEPAKKEEEEPKAEVDEAEQKLIDDLRKQIEERKKELEAKKEEKAKKDAENDQLQQEADTVRKNFKEKQDQLNNLHKEQQALEKEKNEVQPPYERALENKELRDRADALKREIETEENTLAAKQGEVASLETRLEEVSAAYKREREAKDNFQKAANQQLDALRSAVNNKLDLILPIDDEENETYLNPDETIEAAETIFRQRGNELANNTKLSRELEAIVEMKKEAVADLESNTTDQLREASENHDESIREMIFQMQEERNNLHADIEEIKKINREQSQNLRRGHVEKHVDTTKFRKPSSLQPHLTPRTDPHTRHSVFKRDAKMSDEMKLMVVKNKEMETELNDVKTNIATAVTERTETLKQNKILEARIQRDTKTFETELARIEAEILSTEHKVQLMERENSRMTEAVEHLGGLIKSTKDHMEHVRGKTEPLPLE